MAGVQEQFSQKPRRTPRTTERGRARKSVLEDLESRQEGLGIGVKEILSRARTARTSPWNQILGSVADLLEVDLEHAGARRHCVGSPSASDRRRRHARVRRVLSSRAWFRSPDASNLSTCRKRRSTIRGTSDVSRARGRSSESPNRDTDPRSSRPELVCRRAVPGRFAGPLLRKTPSIGERLLCDTWVVDTIETAFELAAERGAAAALSRCRVS